MPRCFWAFLVLLSGCFSMSEQEKTKNIISTPDIDKSITQSLDSGVFIKGSFPKETWWEDFQSPVLNEWIEKAFQLNPSLHSVESRIEQARQTSVKARSKLFPLIFFNADDSLAFFSQNSLTHLFNKNLPLHGYEVDLSLSFQYEFDFWGKYRNIFQATIGETQARQAELQLAKLILASSLAQSYFALFVLKQKQILYENLCDVRKLRLDLQNSLFTACILSKIPALLSNETLQEAKQSLVGISDQIQTQKHLINILIGQSPDTDANFDQIQASALAPLRLPDNLSINLLSRRPDLAAQIWRIEALSHLVSAAKADFFPNINLMAFTGLSSVFWNKLFTSGSKTAGMTPALSLPIFTAGAIRAGVKEKKALFDQAVFDYNELVLQSVHQVCDLLVHLQTVFSQKTMQEQSIQDAQKRLSLIQLKTQSGIDDQLTPLDFEEEVILQKIQNLTLLYSEYAFAIKLIQALGGGYQYTQNQDSL